MKQLFFVFALVLGMANVVRAQEANQNDFWNFAAAYVHPVTSSQSSTTMVEVPGFTRTSVWDDMAKAFSTFVQGLSIRIW